MFHIYSGLYLIVFGQFRYCASLVSSGWVQGIPSCKINLESYSAYILQLKVYVAFLFISCMAMA